METVNLLYRQLFLNGETSKIEISSYLKSTIDNTIDSILGPDFHVEKKLDISNVDVSNEMALNLGMIVNEMCLNACKHAMSIDNNLITLILSEDDEGIEMIFADNGLGFPESFDWKTSNSFGIQLIKLLASDLDANLKVDSSEGVRYTLAIPNNI